MHTQYLWGVFWSLCAWFISALNDVAFKYLGTGLPSIVVLFFRFAFSTLTLLPFVWANPKQFVTKNFWMHGMRGGLFALGMLPWSYGLQQLPLPLMTMLSFSTPLFVTLLARVVLKENVGWARGLATVLGFLGVCISVGATYSTSVNVFVAIALVATLIFAILDIVNKRLLILHENVQPMIFFSALWTSIFTAPLAIMDWRTPQGYEWVWLLVLGLGANGMLGSLLKASKACDLSALQPWRYTEFVFSSIMSIIIFHQWPTWQVLCGIGLIVPATLYLSRHELRLEKDTPPAL